MVLKKNDVFVWCVGEFLCVLDDDLFESVWEEFNDFGFS